MYTNREKRDAYRILMCQLEGKRPLDGWIVVK
jgi:hypothetical protein